MPYSTAQRPWRSDPWRLALGLLALFCGALFAAPAQAQPRGATQSADEARVTFVRGSVEVLAPDARPLREGDVLTRGMRVRTGAGASASLALPNGAVVELDESALLTLFASPTATPPGTPPSTTTTLSRGALRVRMAATGSRTTPVPIQTEAVTVWAGRADAMVAADLGGHITRMAVWRGRMRVRVGSREYLLTQGYGVMEEAGRAPGVLRLLPRAPVWRAAPPNRMLSFGEPLDVEGAWGQNPRAGFPAAQWKVEVARDETFRDLVESVVVPVATTRWRGRQYAPGTYHVRVVAVDVHRFESASSPVARVQIAAPMVIPASDPPEGRRATVRVPRGFYCGLDGAALSSWEEPLVLAPGRPHRLRCALHPSGREARERLLPAGLSGPLSREVHVTPPAADANDGPATGSLSLRLRDSEGEPVSLAHVEATATDGVTVDPVRETDRRGVYTATVHWPRGVRSCRVHFTINEALRFDQDARVERVQVVAPRAAAAPRVDPSRPHVEVLRIAPPRDPDDEEPVNPEE